MKRALVLSVLIAVAVSIVAQPLERAGWITIGISPSFLIEPYDEHANTVEVNVLPLTVEVGLSDAWAIEFRPIINLRFKPDEPVSISHLGMSVVAPRYLGLPWWQESGIEGILAPVVTWTYNLQDLTTTLTLAGEAGASIPFSEPWILDTQFQFGTTLFWETGGDFSQAVPHIGLFVIPGVRVFEM